MKGIIVEEILLNYLFSKSGFADDIRVLEDPEVHLIDSEELAEHQ